MEELSNGEQDLVALGAAVGSNCLPCVEHYISEARRAGLTDRQIEDAIRLADGVRRVPAQKVLDAARGLLSKAARQEAGSAPEGAPPAPDQGCRVAAEETPDTKGAASQPASADRKTCCV